MKFRWLPDELVHVLFENDEIVAVDKPYGLDTHTNESKAGENQADFVRPGLIELFEKQLNRPLHIVHRLDRTTTGVIVFAKTLEAAKSYQGFFRARETKKHYTFVTGASSAKDRTSCAQPIIRNGAELSAETDFSVTERQHGFERWDAFPKTGRNHQIRIHAAALGLPLLGDEKYGGAPFPFLCLHNRRIEFPNGVAIESRPPVYFDDLAILKNTKLSEMLLEIDQRLRIFSREKLASGDASIRWIQTDKKSAHRGLALDQLGPQCVLSWFQDRWTAGDEEIFTRVANELEKPITVRFMSKAGKDAFPKGISIGGTTEAMWQAHEGALKSELNLDSGVGLFLDQRLQRKWVLENAKDQSVLNLFSYTGSFSVAAAQGGASQIVSVDSNKNMLNWSRRNFEINELDASSFQFLCRDALAFADQAKTKNQKFDLIICDPPAFSRGDNGVFKIEVELEGLLRRCLELLAPNGRLLFSSNAETLFVDDIRKAILKVQTSLKIKVLEIVSLQPSLDFEAPDETPGLKSFLITCTSS